MQFKTFRALAACLLLAALTGLLFTHGNVKRHLSLSLFLSLSLSKWQYCEHLVCSLHKVCSAAPLSLNICHLYQAIDKVLDVKLQHRILHHEISFWEKSRNGVNCLFFKGVGPSLQKCLFSFPNENMHSIYSGTFPFSVLTTTTFNYSKSLPK